MAKIGLRIWILLIVLALALLSISPSLKQGVVITSVEANSTAFNEGLRSGMQINAINGEKISSLEEYTTAVRELFTNNETVKMTVDTSDESIIIYSNQPPALTVGMIPHTRIKTGLDLSGGARALIRPANITLSASQTDDLIAVMNERLNVYGIRDVVIRPARDLEGNNFVLVEIAGATPADIQSLLGEQGKFEAKVGNTTVFEGGKDKEGISDVCRNDATCAAITGCFPSQEGYACNFQFTVYLTEKAAERHADITRNVPTDDSGDYLAEKLYLYIDGTEVDSLLISTDLKGRATTQISIQGSGIGANEEEAYEATKKSMQRLQTVLITGSLPYKLEIVKLDTVSPLLGKAFTKSLFTLALTVFIIISLAIFVKYRKIKLTGAVILTMFSEAFITLGIASLINWNLDAPSIAGIIAGMGTGVNDQIIIIDESVSNKEISVKERIKRALFVIFGAFATIVAAMLPLFWAGAGLLRGFAFTTIIGVTVGILITRPAFAEIVRKMEEKN